MRSQAVIAVHTSSANAHRVDACSKPMYTHMSLNLRDWLARSTCLALLFERVSQIEYVHRHRINIRVGRPSICEHELTKQPDLQSHSGSAILCARGSAIIAFMLFPIRSNSAVPNNCESCGNIA